MGREQKIDDCGLFVQTTNALPHNITPRIQITWIFLVGQVLFIMIEVTQEGCGFRYSASTIAGKVAGVTLGVHSSYN